MLPLLFSVVVSAPAPPPPAPAPLVPVIIGSGPSAKIPASDMMVEIRAGGSLLWAGPMRVAERSSAMFNQQKNDAPRTECTLDQPEYFGVARSSLSVNLSVVRYGANASGYQIRVSWEHPAADSGCDGERSTRSVGIQQSFQLEPGRETSISGDGGLAVTIRRR